MGKLKGSLATAGDIPEKKAEAPAKKPALKGALMRAGDLGEKNPKTAERVAAGTGKETAVEPAKEAVPEFRTPEKERAKKIVEGSGSLPVFTPPTEEAVPVFTPPTEEAAPVFTDSAKEAAPTFTPPPDDIPVFTPPTDDIPIFTPPPEGSFTGPACFHHKDFPAVDNCVRCGKPVCQDCKEAYGVVSGEYAGRCLCYTCCRELVRENVEYHKKLQKKLITLAIGTGIGMIFGFGVFISYGIGPAIFGMLWFGSFWNWIKQTFLSYREDKKKRPEDYDGGYGSFMSILILAAVQLLLAPVYTVLKIFRTTMDLIRANKIIQQDSAALTEIDAYMEYTVICQRNAGASLNSLMAEGGELHDNIYAINLRDNGEAAADESLRRCTTTIAENGEIIRRYAA